MPRQLLLDALDRKPVDIDDETPLDELAKKFKVSKIPDPELAADPMTARANGPSSPVFWRVPPPASPDT